MTMNEIRFLNGPTRTVLYIRRSGKASHMTRALDGKINVSNDTILNTSRPLEQLIATYTNGNDLRKELLT